MPTDKDHQKTHHVPQQHQQALQPSRKERWRGGQSDFQKNYPKNIFIPLTEYLTELGYQHAYEQCVGSRADIENKNVVSLHSLQILLGQDWYCRNINKVQVLAHVSNKILLNSKIKKKLFHLLMAHFILTQDPPESIEFRRRVSRQANIISRKPLPTDELFDYPNSIIYLLHLFRGSLLVHSQKKGAHKQHIEQWMGRLSLQEQPISKGGYVKGQLMKGVKNEVKGGKDEVKSSKQEYKFYVKEIVHALSSKAIGIAYLNDILQHTRQTIIERDQQLKEKYQLTEGIPNWALFIDVVVDRSLQQRRKELKVTNFLFNQWVAQYKTKLLTPKGQLAPPKQSPHSHQTYQSALPAALPIESQLPPMPVLTQPTQQGQAKTFAAIVLSGLDHHN